jgi:hypothetical protein
MHLSQWRRRHFKPHHGMQYVPHHGNNEEMGPARYNDWSQWIILRINEWGKPNLMCKAEEKI